MAEKEYIEREALGIGKCNPDVFEDKGYAKGWNAAIDIVQNAPAADVRPVVRGKWILKDDGRAHCSMCDMPGNSHVWHFCPKCGADMREEHDD